MLLLCICTYERVVLNNELKLVLKIKTIFSTYFILHSFKVQCKVCKIIYLAMLVESTLGRIC